MKDLTENLKREAIDTMANGFIRLPRFVTEGIYSDHPSTRQISQLFHYLLVFSAHSAKMMEFRGRKHLCRKGEIFTSAREIAKKTDIHNRMVDRLLYKLKKQGLIETTPMKVGQLIRIIHYGQFTSARKNGKAQTAQPIILTIDGKTPERVAYEEAILEKRRQQMKNY